MWHLPLGACPMHSTRCVVVDALDDRVRYDACSLLGSSLWATATRWYPTTAHTTNTPKKFTPTLSPSVAPSDMHLWLMEATPGRLTKDGLV